jgi:hypothetical protein
MAVVHSDWHSASGTSTHVGATGGIGIGGLKPNTVGSNGPAAQDADRVSDVPSRQRMMRSIDPEISLQIGAVHRIWNPATALSASAVALATAARQGVASTGPQSCVPAWIVGPKPPWVHPLAKPTNAAIASRRHAGVNRVLPSVSVGDVT